MIFFFYFGLLDNIYTSTTVQSKSKYEYFFFTQN